MLNAILTFARAVDKHRNRFCHWIWATCTEVEDGFLVIDPSENFQFLVEVHKQLEKGMRYATGKDIVD